MITLLYHTRIYEHLEGFKLDFNGNFFQFLSPIYVYKSLGYDVETIR